MSNALGSKTGDNGVSYTLSYEKPYAALASSCVVACTFTLLTSVYAGVLFLFLL